MKKEQQDKEEEEEEQKQKIKWKTRRKKAKEQQMHQKNQKKVIHSPKSLLFYSMYRYVFIFIWRCLSRSLSVLYRFTRAGFRFKISLF